jgi:hypothetical protein
MPCLRAIVHCLPSPILERRCNVDIETALKSAMEIDGALGAALVDYESGMALGVLGGGRHLDLEVAAAGNTEVIRAKLRTMASLNLGDEIEDVLITLKQQYHLIRLLSAERSASLFLYIALDRSRANLAMARHQLRRIEAVITA